MEEIKNDTKKWKYIPCSRTGKHVKTFMLAKAIHRFSAIPIKNTPDIFHRTETNNPKINIKQQKTLNSPSNIEKKEQSWRYQSPQIQTILQNCSIQNSMVLAQI